MNNTEKVVVGVVACLAVGFMSYTMFKATGSSGTESDNPAGKGSDTPAGRGDEVDEDEVDEDEVDEDEVDEDEGNGDDNRDDIRVEIPRGIRSDYEEEKDGEDISRFSNEMGVVQNCLCIVFELITNTKRKSLGEYCLVSFPDEDDDGPYEKIILQNHNRETLQIDHTDGRFHIDDKYYKIFPLFDLETVKDELTEDSVVFEKRGSNKVVLTNLTISDIQFDIHVMANKESLDEILNIMCESTADGTLTWGEKGGRNPRRKKKSTKTRRSFKQSNRSPKKPRPRSGRGNGVRSRAKAK